MDILDALLLGENTLVQHREVGLNVFDTGFVLIVEIHLFLLWVLISAYRQISATLLKQSIVA
jgi:hypothetical protein